MGHQHWAARHLEKATALYQLAASVDNLNESTVQTYFIASRHLKKTDVALALLKKRNERLISRSSQPARTYFWALDVLDMTVQAFEVLTQALSRRIDDGDLMLYTADAYGRCADFARARQLHESARGRTHHAQWLRADARLSAYEGDLLGALSTWNKVLETEPLAGDANREVARLIAQTRSTDAAIEHLDAIVRRFDFNTELAQLRISWLRSRGHSAVAAAAAMLVEKQPANVWARVEVSLSLTELGHPADALVHADAAIEISPYSTSAIYARAIALERMLKLDQARAEYKKAVAISVDYVFAMRQLVATYASIDQQREALEFIKQELLRQVVFGEGLLTYRREAAVVIEPEVLLETLQLIKTKRPDLWQAWSTVVYELAQVGRLDEALSVASESVERFPLLPRVWYDLSYVEGLRGDREKKIAALIKCLTIAPGWSFAARQLADTYRLEGNDTEAVAVLRRTIRARSAGCGQPP